MKKKIYIILSTFLFLLLGTLFVFLVEFLVIKIMISDFDKYSFGLTWSTLMLVRNIFSILVFVVFSILGYFVGQKWWNYVYVDKKYKKI